MASYEAELLTTDKFQGNAVVKFGGLYYATRQPDSGLSIPAWRARAIASLVVNPTSIDPKRVSTTIGQYSFSLLDKNGGLSSIIKDTGEDVMNQTLELWLGRTGVSMDFADYYKMPNTTISKMDKIDCGWAFSTRESTERIARPLYAKKVRLSGEIVGGTTIISSHDAITAFPSSGFFQLDKEIIYYGSKDDGLKTFYDCERGSFGTTAVYHEDFSALQIAETVTANPVDIILQLLLSKSGTSAYDLLADGLSFDESLIDIDGMETMRDEFFPEVEFSLALYDIESALAYIEEQLLAPLNVRLVYNSGKLGLALLNRAEFADVLKTLDHDTIVGNPKMSLDTTKVVNQISISWDFSETEGRYRKQETFPDDDSIALYGASAPITYSFKGTADDAFVENFAAALLDRLSTPKPEVEVRAFISRGTMGIGDKGHVETTRLPDQYGELNFSADMEVINRAVNYQTGEVKLKLVYTAYTNVRLGYIAPSDTVLSSGGQDEITLAAGRADRYRAGWKMRLWNNALNEYETDAVNEIAAIDGDVLTFTNDWTTTLTTDHRIKFADFDDVVESQRRYAFVGITGSDFSDRQKSYKIVP